MNTAIIIQKNLPRSGLVQLAAAADGTPVLPRRSRKQVGAPQLSGMALGGKKTITIDEEENHD
jgi:hypothetical protein